MLAPEVRRKTENWKALKGVLLEMSEQTRSALVEEITALTGRPTVRRAARSCVGLLRSCQEGRLPAIFREAQQFLNLADGQWGAMVRSGILTTLSAGCRKVTQSMWGQKIREALHYYEYSECEPETVYLNHSYEDAFLLLT